MKGTAPLRASVIQRIIAYGLLRGLRYLTKAMTLYHEATSSNDNGRVRALSATQANNVENVSRKDGQRRRSIFYLCGRRISVILVLAVEDLNLSVRLVCAIRRVRIVRVC